MSHVNCIFDRGVIGMYLSDSGSLYNTSNNTSNSVIETEYSQYLPILELFDFDSKRELRFVDGVSLTNEIQTYNRNLPGSKLNDTVIRRSKLDVTQNDLFLGPIRILLNFSQHNVTMVTNDNIRKTFVPLQSDRMGDFEGKVLIMSIHSLNTPTMIHNLGGPSNYLEVLFNQFKNNSNPNNVTFKAITEYANRHWSSVKMMDRLSKSNSIKLVTLVEVDIAMHSTSVRGKSSTDLYILGQDVMLSYDDIITCKQHPKFTDPIKELSSTSLLENSFVCYIVDNEDMIGDRYTAFAGKALKVPKCKSPVLLNGLYIIAIKENGEKNEEEFIRLEDIDNSPYVYRTFEEALEGSDIKTKYKDQIEQARLSLEDTKINSSKELLRLKSEYETNMFKLKEQYETTINNMQIQLAEIKSNTDATKATNDIKITEKKTAADDFKTTLELMMLERKQRYEDISLRNKTDYEVNRYHRDTTLETIKTVSALAGAVAAGYLIFSKLQN